MKLFTKAYEYNSRKCRTSEELVFVKVDKTKNHVLFIGAGDQLYVWRFHDENSRKKLKKLENNWYVLRVKMDNEIFWTLIDVVYNVSKKEWYI